MKRLDISGQRFGKLVALRQGSTDQSPSRPHIRWECLCDCGSVTLARLNNLRSGRAISCGCIKKSGDHKRRHGMSGTPEYMAWHRMKRRCTDPLHPDFPDYGARGITVCNEWMASFESFIANMGLRPSDAHSIERLNVNGNYEPENCVWADDKAQSRNKRNSVYYEHNGLRMCQTDWADKLSISTATLIQRVRTWGVYRALTTPKGAKN
jgi:hypothetical protein